MEKIIIAGGREFNNYHLLKEQCDILLKDVDSHIEIVSGHCRGADKLGEQYADDKLYDKAIFPANWKRYFGGAGYMRNEKMAKYADRLIAFWDGKSHGTRTMIDLAKKYNLKVAIITYT